MQIAHCKSSIGELATVVAGFGSTFILKTGAFSVVLKSSSGKSWRFKAKAASAAAASRFSGKVSTDNLSELSSFCLFSLLPKDSSSPPNMSSPSEAVNDSRKLLILFEDVLFADEAAKEAVAVVIT